MSFTDLTLEDYTSQAVVVQGDTRKYKEDLKKLGGKYNGRLKTGPGWIFPKTSESDIRVFIESGKRLVTNEEAKAGEERTKKWANEYEEDRGTSRVCKRSYTKSSEPALTPHLTPTLTEYAALFNLVKTMSTKMLLIEHAVLMLLDDEQKQMLEELMKPKEKKEKKVKVVKNKPTSDSDSDSDKDSEDDEEIPRKRLLRK